MTTMHRFFAFILLLLSFTLAPLSMTHAAPIDPPTVNGFWPGAGPPGTFVFVFGSNYDTSPGATKVNVNGVNAVLVQVIDQNLLIFMLPSGNTAGPITVTTALGSATSTTSFGSSAPMSVTGIWQGEGPPGSIVFVFGSGFVSGSTQVSMNGLNAPLVQVVSPGLLIFVVPLDATTGVVTVKAPLGTASSVELYAVRRTGSVTLVHMGDLHGHLVPRHNVRSNSTGQMEGGVARVYARIKQIRGGSMMGGKSTALLLNTGDTIQGSTEALFTRGQAMVDVLDSFGIDNYAPGNWDWVYGKARFEELFVNNADPANRRFGGLAANVYHYDAGQPVYNRVHSRAEEDAYSSYYIANGTRLLPPTAVRTVNGIRIGIIGCTTSRGPQVVGAWVTEGLAFTDCSREIPIFAKKLRVEQKVDIVVMISEIEIGRNIANLQKVSDPKTHVDVVLNSDMHEETLKPVTFTNTVGQRTLLSEAGQDGTLLGELKLNISAAKIASWNFTAHRINDSIVENADIANKVALARAPYTDKFAEYQSDPVKREAFHKNVFSGTYLQDRVDAPVGDTLVALHRAGYTDEAFVTGNPKALSAVIEGTSHDWMADAIRWWSGSDLATVRGFRYGTHIPVGKKITREDLYHYVPIGARIGKAGHIHAGNLRNQLDNSSLGVFSTDPNDPTSLNAPYGNEGWAGGWMFAYSGPTLSFDPYWIRRGPNPANAVINGVTLPAYPGDSRSRSIKVTMPCNRLPAAERAACDASGLGKAVTTVNNATDGKWMPSWAAAVTENTDADPANDIVVWTSQLGAEPQLSPAWQNKSGKPTAQHQLPVMTVAGYYYAQSPDTLNNCPNCNPVGYSNDDNSADAPYILPVNMDPATGRGMLDAAGKPVMQRNPDGSLVRDSENRPQSDGEPIEFVEILVKYLQAAENAYDTERGRGPANPAHPRITLLKPLPGRAVFGFPVMQPLCGTVASIFSIPTSLWNDPTTVRLTPAIIPCPASP